MISSLSLNTMPFAVIGGSLFVMSILVSLGMLVQKELAVAQSAMDKMKLFGQVLFIGLAPLLIALLVVIIRSTSQVLR